MENAETIRLHDISQRLRQLSRAEDLILKGLWSEEEPLEVEMEKFACKKEKTYMIRLQDKGQPSPQGLAQCNTASFR